MGFPGGSMQRTCLPVQETWFWSLCQEAHLEKEMATCSSILAWEIPWIEEPGGLESTGSQRVGHDFITKQQQQQLASYALRFGCRFSLKRRTPCCPSVLWPGGLAGTPLMSCANAGSFAFWRPGDSADRLLLLWTLCTEGSPSWFSPHPSPRQSSSLGDVALGEWKDTYWASKFSVIYYLTWSGEEI